MTNLSKFFVEIDCAQISMKGQSVTGDTCIIRRHNNRIIMVMADGKAMGIVSKVKAEVVASMAIAYTLSDETATHAAEMMVRTFGSDLDTYGLPATFTILDIHRSGTVKALEFGDMSFILLRGDKPTSYKRTVTPVKVGDKEFEVYTSTIKVSAQDRIILPTKGVALSGKRSNGEIEGWGIEGIVGFCIEQIDKNKTISAREMCKEVVAKAELNEIFSPKHDLTCGVVYFRQPRKILVCSGPPYNERKDDILADMVENYMGTKLICGGTTAQIISRELERSVSIDLKRDPAGLPPTGMMDGVDLVTEGVLTLTKVKSVLEMSQGSDIMQKGTDGEVARMLLDHDIIEFVVGTRINPVHQNPDLPLELEVRRNLIKDLARLLEEKYMKEVNIKYI